MGKKIDKPILLKLRELEEEIIKLINSSEIPAFILKPSIEKVYRQLELIEIQDFSKAKEEYQKAINDEK